MTDGDALIFEGAYSAHAHRSHSVCFHRVGLRSFVRPGVASLACVTGLHVLQNVHVSSRQSHLDRSLDERNFLHKSRSISIFRASLCGRYGEEPKLLLSERLLL